MADKKDTPKVPPMFDAEHCRRQNAAALLPFQSPYSVVKETPVTIAGTAAVKPVAKGKGKK
jgi:hypothetical protein